jgi:hypothetical protein
LDCLDAHGGPASVFLQWAELAHGYADVDSVERVYADLALAGAWRARGRGSEARVLLVESLFARTTAR